MPLPLPETVINYSILLFFHYCLCDVTCKRGCTASRHCTIDGNCLNTSACVFVIYPSGDGVTPLSRLADDDDEMGDEDGKKQLVPR